MTERASVFESAQFGVETQPGTAVAANKTLPAYGLKPSKSGAVSVFTPSGSKFPTVASVGKQMTTWALEGILDYMNVVYMLSGLIAKTTPTTEGTTGKKWIIAPKTNGPDDVATYTIEQGSSVRAHRAPYGQVSGFGFSFSGNDNQVAVSGSVMSQKLEDDITMTASPTEVEVIPAHPLQCNVKLAATRAGLASASVLDRLLNLEWNYNDKYGPVNAIKRDVESYSAVVEQSGALPAGSITLAADSNGMAFVPIAEKGTPYWIEIEFVGDEIESGVNYTLKLTSAILFGDLGELNDTDGLLAVKFNFNAKHDADWGKAFEFEIINTLGSL